MKPQDPLNTLLSKMTDGNLSQSDRKELLSIIANSPDAREQYLAHCQMHAMLKDEYGSFVQAQIERPKKKTPITYSLFSAVAAILVISITALFFNQSGKQTTAPYRGENIAKIGRSIGANFAFGGIGNTSLNDGDEVAAGLYNLQKGIIQLEYPSGVKVVVEAPTQFEVLSEKNIACLEGKMSIHVPQNAKGFTVVGEGVSIVDLGTEFSVHAVRGKFLEAHVYKGLVEVNMYYENGDEKVNIPEGQAVRILMGDTGPVLAGIDLKHDFFIRQITEPNSEYSRLILQKEPVAYYPMEMASDGQTLHDWSKYKNKGTSVGVKDFTSLWTVGKIGNAIQTSGSNRNAYVYVDDYPKSSNNTLSGIGWVYAESRTVWATIVKNWGQAKLGQFHFGLNTTGYLDIQMANSQGRAIHISDSVHFPINKWVHVAFVQDGTSVKLFRDGKVVGQGKVEGIFSPTKLKKLSIGTKLDDNEVAPAKNAGHWDGRLDEIAIFNRALSDAEIVELYEVSK